MATAATAPARILRAIAGPLLVFSLGFAATALGGESLPESRGKIVFWIRAGALAPQEVDPDPELTPALYEMVLEGVTAPALLTEALPKESFAEPAVVARFLFDDSLRKRIEERRGIPPGEVGPRTSLAEPPREVRADPQSPTELLEKRFGRPPPLQESEEEAMRRILTVLGRESQVPRKEPEKPEEKTSTPSPEERIVEITPDARGLKTMEQAIRAIENGAPLVIACEPVQAPAEVRERDLVLQDLVSWILKHEVILMFLSLRETFTQDGTAPAGTDDLDSRAALFIRGSGVRSARIIGGPLPLTAARATALRILGVPPLVSDVEAIHVLEK